jgi:DNA-binding transcriptional ArsR family regulator
MVCPRSRSAFTTRPMPRPLSKHPFRILRDVTHPLDIPGVARLFADPSRAAMLEVLMDGQEHPVGALARAARVAPSTAIEHVRRLEAGGLVATQREGRRRLVHIAEPGVAAAFEALGHLSAETPAAGLRATTQREQLAKARMCYDHLAGRLGVAIADAAQAAGALEPDFSLNPDRTSWFRELGVEIDALVPGRRPLLRVCVDWTERREHLAGALGAAICSAVLSAGWAVRRPSSRALAVTPAGHARLREIGIQR